MRSMIVITAATTLLLGMTTGALAQQSRLGVVTGEDRHAFCMILEEDGTLEHVSRTNTKVWNACQKFCRDNPKDCSGIAKLNRDDRNGWDLNPGSPVPVYVGSKFVLSEDFRGHACFQSFTSPAVCY